MARLQRGGSHGRLGEPARRRRGLPPAGRGHGRGAALRRSLPSRTQPEGARGARRRAGRDSGATARRVDPERHTRSQRCSSMNEDTLRAAETWRTRGDAVALATLVRSRRRRRARSATSSPSRSRGEMAGSVSGGCVEGAVFEEAQSRARGRPVEAPLLRHRRRPRLERRPHLRRRDLGLARGVPRLAGAGRALRARHGGRGRGRRRATCS